MCGKGNSGRGYWRDCLVHDACVWANCDRPDAIPGGFFLFRPFGNDPSLDLDCGTEYDYALNDWLEANLVSCEDDADCETGRCAWKYGLHCLPKLHQGSVCEDHSDCATGRCTITGTLPTCEHKIEPRALGAAAPPAVEANGSCPTRTPLMYMQEQCDIEDSPKFAWLGRLLQDVRQSFSFKQRCVSDHDCDASYCDMFVSTTRSHDVFANLTSHHQMLSHLSSFP
mmetsp:Transcript_34912/g.109689  ORF Transcript_34912/g.109689 Transcript_34912/m.109689 type:complete len:226 (+) Transcript_34912:452-1129(+)